VREVKSIGFNVSSNSGGYPSPLHGQLSTVARRHG
jgi:hypothetical protein